MYEQDITKGGDDIICRAEDSQDIEVLKERSVSPTLTEPLENTRAGCWCAFRSKAMTLGFDQKATLSKLEMRHRRLHKSEVSYDSYSKTGNIP